MRVGLGTGSTVAPFIPALAARGLRVRCVATSEATAQRQSPPGSSSSRSIVARAGHRDRRRGPDRTRAMADQGWRPRTHPGKAGRRRRGAVRRDRVAREAGPAPHAAGPARTARVRAHEHLAAASPRGPREARTARTAGSSPTGPASSTIRRRSPFASTPTRASSATACSHRVTSPTSWSPRDRTSSTRRRDPLRGRRDLSSGLCARRPTRSQPATP